MVQKKYRAIVANNDEVFVEEKQEFSEDQYFLFNFHSILCFFSPGFLPTVQ